MSVSETRALKQRQSGALGGFSMFSDETEGLRAAAALCRAQLPEASRGEHPWVALRRRARSAAAQEREQEALVRDLVALDAAVRKAVTHEALSVAFDGVSSEVRRLHAMAHVSPSRWSGSVLAACEVVRYVGGKWSGQFGAMHRRSGITMPIDSRHGFDPCDGTATTADGEKWSVRDIEMAVDGSETSVVLDGRHHH